MVRVKPLSDCYDISGDMRRYKASYNSAYRRGWPRVVAQNFRSNSSTGATQHVYDIFGEIVTD